MQLSTSSLKELKPLILHELAHVKRFDLFVNWIQVVLQVTYWYNPIVWLVNREIRREREQACDDRVLVATGFRRKEYGSSLIKALEASPRPAPLLLGLVGVIEPWDSLKVRLRRIMDVKRGISARLTVSSLLLVLALACVLLPMHPRAETGGQDIGSDINAKVARLDIDTATLNDVIEVFGEPEKYVWGQETFTRDNLPSVYCVAYPNRFLVVMKNGKIDELRFHEPGYVFAGNLQVGSDLDDVLEVVGQPTKTVEGERGWQDGVLYKDMNGRKGWCYYQRPDKGVRFFFSDYKVSALYVTRTDYGDATADISAKVEQLTSRDTDRPEHMPETSTFDSQGRIVDKINWPFVDDPDVIGTWKSVDFVREIEEFDPQQKRWNGDLYLKKMAFLEGGKTYRPWWTWTKALIFHSGDRTASKYVIKEIGGATYMFFEWKSGDYTIRHMKPHYYVLRKVSSEVSEDDRAWATAATDDPAFRQEVVGKLPKLDIDKATLQDVTDLFGEPRAYVWGSDTFKKEALPEHFILSYPDRFDIYMRGDHIVELRFYNPGYFLRDMEVQVGSALEDVVDLVGEPVETVMGKPNAWKDGVLYKDIDGRKGYCYYQRDDQNVRMFFADYKVNALYLTARNRPSNVQPNRRDNRESRTSGIRLSGRVLSEDSKRLVKYAEVYCMKDGEKFEDIRRYPYDGVYDIRLPMPGTYMLQWRSLVAPREAGFEYSRQVELGADENKEIDVTLPESVTMSVRLVDDEGNPVVGVAIGPWYMRPSGDPFRYGGGNRTDKSGRFELEDFMPGVESGFNTGVVDGYTQLDTEGVIGEPGQVFPEVTVVLDKLRGSVKATIVDADGNPTRQQSLFVRTRYDDGKHAVQLYDTDSNGELTAVVGRPGREFTLSLQNNGGRYACRWTSLSMEISPDETRDLGRIVSVASN